MIPTRIYLSGFMGAGKSTLGRSLARRLDYGFVDLDARIASRAGRSIERIFADSGESEFRRLERDALYDTANLVGYVVALGGGALMDLEAMTWAKDHGMVVYVDATAKLLVQRLASSRTERPLLRDDAGDRVSEAELARRVSELLEARRPAYREAHVSLRIDGGAVGDNVDALEQLVRAGLPR